MNEETLTMEKVVGRMERLPFTGIQKKVFAVAAAGYLFDAFDITLLSFVMPSLSADLGLSGVQIGLLFSFTFFGMMIGSSLGGALADYCGRLKVFKYSLLVFAFGTAATAFASSFEILCILRFITGLGLGGEQPVVFAYVGEMMPSRLRGRMSGMTQSMWGAGTLLSAGISLLVVPIWGWRAAFLSGILPAILVWYMRKDLPESPRWFIMKGDVKRAEEELAGLEKRIEKSSGQPLPEPQPVEPISVFKGNKYKVLFVSKYTKRTVMLLLAWFCWLFGMWGLNAWMPTLLKQAGYSMVASIGYVFIMNLVWIPSGLLASYLSDKIGRKWPMAVSFLLVGLHTAIYGWALVNHMPAAVILGCGISLIVFTAAASAFLYIYTPENYPTEIRGTGSGLANSSGRIGGILAPVAVGYLYPIIGLTYTLCVVAFSLVVGATVIVLLGKETKGMSLEKASR